MGLQNSTNFLAPGMLRCDLKRKFHGTVKGELGSGPVWAIDRRLQHWSGDFGLGFGLGIGVKSSLVGAGGVVFGA